jgi:hypothetical protein
MQGAASVGSGVGLTVKVAVGLAAAVPVAAGRKVRVVVGRTRAASIRVGSRTVEPDPQAVITSPMPVRPITARVVRRETRCTGNSRHSIMSLSSIVDSQHLSQGLHD